MLRSLDRPEHFFGREGPVVVFEQMELRRRRSARQRRARRSRCARRCPATARFPRGGRACGEPPGSPSRPMARAERPLADLFGVGLLEGVHRWILAVAVVSDFGLVHRVAHLLSRPVDRVASKIDHSRCHPADVTGLLGVSRLGGGSLPWRGQDRARGVSPWGPGLFFTHVAAEVREPLLASRTPGPPQPPAEQFPCPRRSHRRVGTDPRARTTGGDGARQDGGGCALLLRSRRQLDRGVGGLPGPLGRRRRRALPSASTSAGGEDERNSSHNASTFLFCPSARRQSMITGTWLGSSPESRLAASGSTPPHANVRACNTRGRAAPGRTRLREPCRRSSA